jgi:DNA anti-recombination protein RmuC
MTVSFLAASEAGDEAEREKIFKDHTRQVRWHVDDLGSRAKYFTASSSPN